MARQPLDVYIHSDGHIELRPRMRHYGRTFSEPVGPETSAWTESEGGIPVELPAFNVRNWYQVGIVPRHGVRIYEEQ